MLKKKKNHNFRAKTKWKAADFQNNSFFLEHLIFVSTFFNLFLSSILGTSLMLAVTHIRSAVVRKVVWKQDLSHSFLYHSSSKFVSFGSVRTGTRLTYKYIYIFLFLQTLPSIPWCAPMTPSSTLFSSTHFPSSPSSSLPCCWCASRTETTTKARRARMALPSYG